MKWNNLIYGILFSGLGAFSYFLLVDYTNLSPHIADALYSREPSCLSQTGINVLGPSCPPPRFRGLIGNLL